MTEIDTDCIKSQNKKKRVLEMEEPETILPDAKKGTSSALMYSEYVKTSGSERVSKLLEKKKEKPVMISFGESPFYKKYSDLLKKLEESKDDFPSVAEENSPIIEMDVFLKQNIDDDSSSSDVENGRIVFCNNEDSTSDEETTENDDTDIVLTEKGKKVQIISKDCLEKSLSTEPTSLNSTAEKCVFSETLENKCDNTDNSDYK